jgi:Ni/Fe-hydrogenase 1 B-type cytochrome subunit
VRKRYRVYAWELPVRLCHWTNVLCILTLSATGIYISSPFMHAYRPDQYIMGTMRLLHFIAAYTFLMSCIIRLYWSFMGNKYANWRVWFPFSQRRREDMADAVRFYTFMSRKPPYAIGHTALAGLTYLVVFVLFALQIVSGFAMYGLSKPGGVLWTLLGGWLLAVMDIQSIRLFHHMTMYMILAFAAVHIYIAWWLDTVEKNGLMDGIFSGHKFVTGKEWE